jgi:hypothetical protein
MKTTSASFQCAVASGRNSFFSVVCCFRYGAKGETYAVAGDGV